MEKEPTINNKIETTPNPEEIKQEVIEMLDKLFAEIKTENNPEKQQTYLDHVKKVIANVSIEQMDGTYHNI